MAFPQKGPVASSIKYWFFYRKSMGQVFQQGTGKHPFEPGHLEHKGYAFELHFAVHEYVYTHPNSHRVCFKNSICYKCPPTNQGCLHIPYFRMKVPLRIYNIPNDFSCKVKNLHKISQPGAALGAAVPRYRWCYALSLLQCPNPSKVFIDLEKRQKYFVYDS